MLIKAHVLPIIEELRTKMLDMHRGDHLLLPLRLDSGVEETIEVLISAVEVYEFLVRIEGVTSHGSKRSRVIAQILRNTAPETESGFAEIVSYS